MALRIGVEGLTSNPFNVGNSVLLTKSNKASAVIASPSPLSFAQLRHRQFSGMKDL